MQALHCTLLCNDVYKFACFINENGVPIYLPVSNLWEVCFVDHFIIKFSFSAALFQKYPKFDSGNGDDTLPSVKYAA